MMQIYSDRRTIHGIRLAACLRRLGVMVLFLGLMGLVEANPVRPLAQMGVVVGDSPDAKAISVFSPSILRLAGGRLVAAYEQSQDAEGKVWAFILTSDDGGKRWTQRSATRISQGRLFTAGKSVYYLGHLGDLRIVRSDDGGVTWSPAAQLTQGQSWHQTAANVWHANGNVYLVMERRVGDKIKGWFPGELAPVLLRASEHADLLLAASWTFASELPFAQAVAGQANDHDQMELFGVPFYRENYPERMAVEGSRATMAPMGWLEANVVQVMDPKHYWFDPAGHTFHLLMRSHTGGTGYGMLIKVVEQHDGKMETNFERTPAGKKWLYLPLPGGQMRFHILYDKGTALYWMIGSQATDSMTKPEYLPKTRFGLPNNERHRLVLHFSRNLVDWCFAGLVAASDSPLEARHYASMDIDGDDLVVLSRSADGRARSAHDNNLITFHRVKDFRRLVY